MLCLVGVVAGTHAGTLTIAGRVVGVADGDTITMLDVERRQHRIRLDGIDAPPPESGQPFGRASKQHLYDLAFNREAVAERRKMGLRCRVHRRSAGHRRPQRQQSQPPLAGLAAQRVQEWRLKRQPHFDAV